MRNSKGTLFLLSLTLLLPSRHAFAQSCASAAGNWTDNYGQYWQLSQWPDGRITGTVTSADPRECARRVWNVYGGAQGGGLFGWTALNPVSDRCVA